MINYYTANNACMCTQSILINIEAFQKPKPNPNPNPNTIYNPKPNPKP